MELARFAHKLTVFPLQRYISYVSVESKDGERAGEGRVRRGREGEGWGGRKPPFPIARGIDLHDTVPLSASIFANGCVTFNWWSEEGALREWLLRKTD